MWRQSLIGAIDPNVSVMLVAVFHCSIYILISKTVRLNRWKTIIYFFIPKLINPFQPLWLYVITTSIKSCLIPLSIYEISSSQNERIIPQVTPINRYKNTDAPKRKAIIFVQTVYFLKLRATLSASSNDIKVSPSWVNVQMVLP